MNKTAEIGHKISLFLMFDLYIKKLKNKIINKKTFYFTISISTF